jgi:hypothetical protein
VSSGFHSALVPLTGGFDVAQLIVKPAHEIEQLREIATFAGLGRIIQPELQYLARRFVAPNFTSCQTEPKTRPNESGHGCAGQFQCTRPAARRE